LSKGVFVRIRDEKVWIEFKDYVLNKYGKLHTVLGEELTEAIREYLKGRIGGNTHTHSRKSRIVKEAEVLKHEILKIAEPGGSVHKNQITRLAVRSLGIGDWRSVRIRVNYLVGTGFLSTGMYRGAYIVNGGLRDEAINP